MLVSANFKDKSYNGLWETMLTKEPYMHDYKVSKHCLLVRYSALLILVTIVLIRTPYLDPLEHTGVGAADAGSSNFCGPV